MSRAGEDLLGPGSAPSEPIHVLLVEDDGTDAQVVRRSLGGIRDAELTLDWVKTCDEAELRLRSQRFDLVVLDLNLSDTRGRQTLQRLRQVSRTVPMFVLAGGVQPDLRDELLAHGAQEVMSKSDASGRMFGLSVMYVIERNRADEQRRQLERLLQASPDAVIVVDSPGTIKFVNDAALQLFGRRRSDFANEMLTFATKEGVPVEIRIPREDGVRVGEMRVVHFDWLGEHSMLASIRDVTDQKAMEMQLLLSDRMVTIGTLAAGVAHEINNPLASVVANLDLAVQDATEMSRSSTMSPDLLDALQDAREAANQVRHIVRDLKVFSRAEDDKVEAVDVRRVIDSALRMARNEIRHRARIEVACAATPAVAANESRLGQVVLNLLVNAAQAIPEGDQQGHLIRVSTRIGDAGRVHIEVADSGDGIPYEIQKRLFTPFFSTKPVGTGTGLGLAICHRIVTSFGGDIGFRSVPGEGTTFTVTLRAAQAEAPIADEPTKATPSPTRRARIIVVDDDKLVTQAIRRCLGRQHDVESYEDAASALERLREGSDVDIIFCDLMMPQISGIEMYGMIKELGIEDRVIFMTGGAFTTKARNFLDRVPNHRVEKPFDLQGLRALVTDVIRGRGG